MAYHTVNGIKVDQIESPNDWGAYCRAPIPHTGGNCARLGKYIVRLPDGARPKRCLQHADDLARTAGIPA